MSDKQKTVIITAGPTNERIDAVMQITNMSTGALGARIAETMLNADGAHHETAAQIGKLYYLSNKMARKPVVPDGQAYKLELVTITNARNLLETLEGILEREHVDLVVHSCAVGDYEARYSVRGEDLAREITDAIARVEADGWDNGRAYQRVLDVIEKPGCAADDSTKMSSYEPNLMTMMGLTPKVIGCVKAKSPDTMLIGFKLLENVTREHLFEVASNLRQKNQADYIVANDLSLIGNGAHPAFIVGRDHIMDRDAVFAECQTKQDIADSICKLAFPVAGMQLLPEPGHRTVWQVVAANNMNTDVRVEGFSYNKANAWSLMVKEFVKTMHEMLADVHVEERAIINTGTWTYDDERRRASIGPDNATVYDGEDMWYYNIVPVSEIPVEQEHWSVSGPGMSESRDTADDAWLAMWVSFKQALCRIDGKFSLTMPDSRDIMDTKTWGTVEGSVRASAGPMSADIYDGASGTRMTWTIAPV